MYRHGFGDCLLVTLPREGGDDYHLLIDCGVILGTANAKDEMSRVLQDVLVTTDNKVDVLAATREHWDHVSGFIQAAELFDKLRASQVWLAWTEDPNDELGRKLAGERAVAMNGLQLSAGRLQVVGDTENAHVIGTLLEFFGAAPGRSTRDALEAVRAKSSAPRYCKPADPPIELEGSGARIYVLGPPRDETLIKKTLPEARNPETYGFSLALAAFQNYMLTALNPDPQNPDTPFSTMYSIPNHFAQEMDFFKGYWGGDDWRRVDGAWLADSTELALQLDASTNNTSLVLAIELDRSDRSPDGDVLLFAADAQVGNWLSWQDLRWTVSGRTVTGPDLLARTVLYKVGHHGSHNATLRTLGLELMKGLQLAMIPVFREMAIQKRWGHMPLPELVKALTEQTGHNAGVVLQSDDEKSVVVANDKVRVVENEDPRYYEVTLLW